LANRRLDLFAFFLRVHIGLVRFEGKFSQSQMRGGELGNPRGKR